MGGVTARSETGLTSPDGATRLPVLRACLRSARRRWRVGALLTCAVWSVIAALALLCLQAAAALWYEGGAISGLMASGTASPTAIAPALGLFGAAFAIGCLVLCLRTPDLGNFARAADQRLALREQLSTALEVDARAPPGAPLDLIRDALLADVERRARDIDPRAIVRLGVPRAIWLVPTLVVIAALLHLVPVDAFASRNPVADASEHNALSKGANENSVTNLRRIADLLKADAEQRADPYLRTIARALERLSNEVEHASVDKRQLASALDQLLAHSRQAYAQNSNGDGGEAHAKAIDLLAAARDDITGLPRDRTAASRQADSDGAAAPGAEQAAPRAAMADPSPSRQQRQARPVDVAPPLSDRVTDDAGAQKEGDEYGDLENDPRTQKERAFAEQQRRIRAAAQAVGAAADAGAGEGDRAGNGTRPLASGAPARTDLAPGADMLLPDQAGNDGRRIRLELTPQTTLSDVAPPAASGDRNWRHTPEQPVARPALDARDRAVVGRYFKPTAESGGR